MQVVQEIDNKINDMYLSKNRVACVSGWRLKLLWKVEATFRRLATITGDDSYLKRAHKIGMCGNTLKVRREKDTGRYYVSGIRCHDRVCPVCNAFRAGKLSRKVNELQSKMINSHLLTITDGVRVPYSFFEEGLTSFTTSLKKLRRSNWFKDNISGGIYFLEVTYKKGHGWHLHCHMLIDIVGDKPVFNLSGGFENLKVSDFKKGLEYSCKFVGLGAISDIRPCEPNSGAELSKYFYKLGLSLDKENQFALLEMVQVFRGKRIYDTFGSCRGVNKQEDVADTDTELDKELELEGAYDEIGSLDDVVLGWVSFGLYGEIVHMLVRQGYIELESLNYYFSSHKGKGGEKGYDES